MPESPEALLAQLPQALPSLLTNGDQGLAARATQQLQGVLTRLSARKPLFRSTGICVLTVTVDGVEAQLGLPVQSVSFEDTSALLHDAFVDPPRTERTNLSTMQIELVPDTGDIEYQRALTQANTRFRMRRALLALRLDLYDESEQLVWQWNGATRDEEAALAVLRAQGLTPQHFRELEEAAEALTQSQKQRDDASRLAQRSSR